MAESFPVARIRLQSLPLRRLLLLLDCRLRQRHAVFEYTAHPQCILRIQIGELGQAVCLSDGTCANAGQRLIDLHLWTEQIPPMPEQGASIGWARRMNAGMMIALRELALFLTRQPDLNDILILRAKTSFSGRQGVARSVRLMSCYGFESVAETAAVTLRDRARRLAENILITLMVLAHNRPALRGDTLFRARAPLFMSRAVLEQRYLASPRELRSHTCC